MPRISYRAGDANNQAEKKAYYQQNRAKILAKAKLRRQQQGSVGKGRAQTTLKAVSSGSFSKSKPHTTTVGKSTGVYGAGAAAESMKGLGSSIKLAGISGIRQVVNMMIESAKETVPVRTGYLQSTIRVFENGGDYIVWGADAPYTVFVEKGTSRQAAQPFIEPSVLRHQAKVSGLVAYELKKNVG